MHAGSVKSVQAERPKEKPVNTEAQKQNTILLSQMETAETKESSSYKGHETLAEELASAVIDVALREVSRGRNAGEGQADRHQDGGERDILREMDPVKEVQSLTNTQPYRPHLSQAGLPVVGSLDYPDAPPTTPLLPELERSRHSFARKLKGGLATVFLPSPPPPTPKEKEDCSNGSTSNPQVELMEHLMHSLFTDDAARDHGEAGSQHGATLEAFAESLSHDVIDWVLSSKREKQTGGDDSLHLLAQQLAETIITSSLDEAKMLM